MTKRAPGLRDTGLVVPGYTGFNEHACNKPMAALLRTAAYVDLWGRSPESWQPPAGTPRGPVRITRCSPLRCLSGANLPRVRLVQPLRAVCAMVHRVGPGRQYATPHPRGDRGHQGHAAQTPADPRRRPYLSPPAWDAPSSSPTTWGSERHPQLPARRPVPNCASRCPERAVEPQRTRTGQRDSGSPVDGREPTGTASAQPRQCGLTPGTATRLLPP